MKTALKPRWILMLILAMAIASVFVLLSQWQFSSSRSAPPPAPSNTEQVKPLTDVLEPNAPLLATTADQMVSIDGTFLPDTRMLIQNRLREDTDGLWVVQAFEVADAGPDAAVIPVVLGWSPAAESVDDVEPLSGPASVVGRLLPPEAPEVQRPVAGQVPTLSTAELANLWDRTSYAAFVVASEVAVDGAAVPFAADLEPVVVGPQPQETPINWLNIFYAIEWVVFAGFAFFLWWRLVADDYRRTREDEADAAEASAVVTDDARPPALEAASAASQHHLSSNESGSHRA